MGSKNRISKFILPIMINSAIERNINTWVEPFVGGGNMIDKVPNEFKRVGIDHNAHCIEALIAIRDLSHKLPIEVNEQYYKSIRNNDPEPIESWIRFVCSFGAKFNNGFARNKSGRNYAKVAVGNAKKQTKNLQNVKLIHGSYNDYCDFKNCLIYCDPPYEKTTSYKTGIFNHEKFWNWCRVMSRNNLIFVSEYNAPVDFKCIWEGDLKTNFAPQRTVFTHNAKEKLFTI